LTACPNTLYLLPRYGSPKTQAEAVKNALHFSQSYKMATLLTEYGGYGGAGYGCKTQAAASSQGVGSSYWHYSDYCWPKHCAAGTPDGFCPFPDGPSWGACITGWGSANSSFGEKPCG